MSVEVHVTFLFQNSTRSILITIIRVSIKSFQEFTRTIMISFDRVVCLLPALTSFWFCFGHERGAPVLRHHLPVLDLLCRAAVFLIQTNVSLSLCLSVHRM